MKTVQASKQATFMERQRRCQPHKIWFYAFSDFMHTPRLFSIVIDSGNSCYHHTHLYIIFLNEE